MRRTKIPLATPRFNGSVENVHSRDKAAFYDIFVLKMPKSWIALLKSAIIIGIT